MNRLGYLGASDAPVAMGLSAYKTPKELFLEKTGQLEPEDLSDNEYVQTGIAMEHLAFPKIKALTGIDFFSLHDQQFPVDGYDFIKARPDGAGFEMPVVGDTVYWAKSALKNGYSLEIKTVSDQKIREYHKTGIPDVYYVQVQTQLMATNQAKALFFAQSRDSDNVYLEWVAADLHCQETIKRVCSLFWDQVQAGVFKEPEKVEKQLLEPTGENEQLTQQVEELTEAIKKHKEADKDIKKIEAQLKDILKPFDGYKSRFFCVDWQSRKTSSLDKKSLELFLKDKGASLKDFQILSHSAPFLRIKRNEKIDKQFKP